MRCRCRHGPAAPQERPPPVPGSPNCRSCDSRCRRLGARGTARPNAAPAPLLAACPARHDATLSHRTQYPTLTDDVAPLAARPHPRPSFSPGPGHAAFGGGGAPLGCLPAH
jgi:hypothetical protein